MLHGSKEDPGRAKAPPTDLELTTGSDYPGQKKTVKKFGATEKTPTPQKRRKQIFCQNQHPLTKTVSIRLNNLIAISQT